MSESLGLTSHKSSCDCTGCGLLRAGVCINCAEKIAALILESGPRELAVEPCSGACGEAIDLLLLHSARALARAVSALGIGRATAAPVGQANGCGRCLWPPRDRSPITATRRRARPRWRGSPRAGGANS